MKMHKNRMAAFKDRLKQAGVDVALITDDDNVYYLTGYHDYLHMEFGRPTILVVNCDEESLLITPNLDMQAALSTAEVDRVAAWNDGIGHEWRAELPSSLVGKTRIGIEPDYMPPLVRKFLDTLVSVEQLANVSTLLADMRMIKSEEELKLARHAGQVANAMMTAGRAAIADGVPE